MERPGKTTAGMQELVETTSLEEIVNTVGTPPTAGLPTIAGMPDMLETPVAEIKSIAVGAAATAETLATTGSPEPSTGTETPATAETITTAGTHGKPADMITSATESEVTAKEAGLLQDTSREHQQQQRLKQLCQSGEAS
jgi:hypothetical protein